MNLVFSDSISTATPTELVSLLAGYRMLPQLCREVIIDAAIASIELTEQQQLSAIEQFHQKHQLNTQPQQQAMADCYGMKLEQLTALAVRELKLEIFKQATWGAKLESDFLTYKSKLDKVIYSLLRTQNPEVAQELYFRISAGEQSFAQLAQEYSQGAEAQTGGLIGPVELSVPHPELAKLLAISQPGQLWTPTRLGEWFVIMRLEKFIPAVLDEAMRQQLLNRLFETWLGEQVSQQMEKWRTKETETKELIDIHSLGHSPTPPLSHSDLVAV